MESSTIQFPIVDLLKSTSINDLIKGKDSSNLMQLDSSITVSQAIKILAENNVLSMPVFDKEDGSHLGFVDYCDILTFVINMYTEGHQVSETQWNSFCSDIETLQHRSVRFGIKPIKEIIDASHRDAFIPVYGHGTVFQLIEGVFYKGVHRVPVMDEQDKLIAIVTQTDVMNFFGRNSSLMNADLGRQTVKQLKLSTPNVITMSINAQAIHAFHLMYLHKVSAVAIVNSAGMLVANLSASDLKGLVQQQFSSLLLPVPTFISNMKGKVKPAISVTMNTQFETVILQMCLFRIHRLWVVNEDGKPIGVISQSDVMKKLSAIQ
jgi:CBS domain-containing protein